MPVSYSQARQRKRELGLEELPDDVFADAMAIVTGTQDFDVLKDAGLLSRLNAFIEDYTTNTEASKYLGSAGAAVGSVVDSLIGNTERELENTGRAVGEHTLRGVAETIPWFIPGTALPKTALWALRGAGALSSGAGAYDESGGSIPSTLLGAATPALLRGGAEVGAGLGSRLMPKGAVGAAAKVTGPAGILSTEAAQTTTQNLLRETFGRWLGGQTGMMATGEVVGESQSLLRGEGLYNPFTAENVFGQALSQIPFAIFDAKRFMGIPEAVRTTNKGLEAEAGQTVSSFENELIGQLEKYVSPAAVANRAVSPIAPTLAAPEGMEINQAAVQSRFNQIYNERLQETIKAQNPDKRLTPASLQALAAAAREQPPVPKPKKGKGAKVASAPDVQRPPSEDWYEQTLAAYGALPHTTSYAPKGPKEQMADLMAQMRAGKTPQVQPPVINDLPPEPAAPAPIVVAGPKPRTSEEVVRAAFPHASDIQVKELVKVRDTVLNSVKTSFVGDPIKLKAADELFADDPGAESAKLIIDMQQNYAMSWDEAARAVSAYQTRQVLDYMDLKEKPEFFQKAAQDVKAELRKRGVSPFAIEEMADETKTLVYRRAYENVLKEFLTTEEGRSFFMNWVTRRGKMGSKIARQDPARLAQEVQTILSAVFQGDLHRVGNQWLTEDTTGGKAAQLVEMANGKKGLANPRDELNKIITRVFSLFGDGEVLREYVNAHYGEFKLPPLAAADIFQTPTRWAAFKQGVRGEIEVAEGGRRPAMPKGSLTPGETIDPITLALQGASRAVEDTGARFQPKKIPTEPNVIAQGVGLVEPPPSYDFALRVMRRNFAGEPVLAPDGRPVRDIFFFKRQLLEQMARDTVLELGFSQEDAGYLGEVVRVMKQMLPELGDTVGSVLAKPVPTSSDLAATAGTMGFFSDQGLVKGRDSLTKFVFLNKDALKWMFERSKNTGMKFLTLLTSHELHHAVMSNLRSNVGGGFGRRAEIYRRVIDMVNGMSPDQRVEVYREISKELYSGAMAAEMPTLKYFQELAEANIKAKQLDQNLADQEFVAELASLVNLGLATDYLRTYRQATNTPKPVFDFVHSLADGMRKIGYMLRKWIGATSDSTPLKKQAVDIFRELTKAALIDNEIGAALSKLDAYKQFLSATSPPNPRSPLTRGEVVHMGFLGFKPREAVLKAAGRLPDLEGKYAPTPKAYEGYIHTAQNLANRYPILAPVVKVAMDHMSDVSRGEMQMSALLFGEKGPLKDSDFHKLASNSKARSVFNDIAREQQEAGDRQGITFTQADVLQKASEKGLNPSEAKLVSTVFKQIIDAGQAAGGILSLSYKDHMGFVLGKFLMAHNPQMGAPMAKDLGFKLRDALLTKGDATALIQNAVPAGSIPQLLAVGQALMETANTIDQAITSKPHYMSEQRFGDVKIDFITPKGDKGTVAAKNMREAQTEIARLAKAGNRVLDVYTKDDLSPFGKEAKAALLKVDAALEKVVQALPDTFDAAKKAELLDTLRWGSGIIEGSVRGVQQNFIRRQLKPGRETLDYLDNTVHYIRSVAYSTSRQRVMAEGALHLNDPQMLLPESADARRIARDVITNAVNPPYKEWSLAKAVVANYSLGFNFGNLVAEGFQPVTMMVPYLTRYFPKMTVGKAWATIGSAAKEAWGVAFQKTPSFKDPDLQSAYTRALSEGHLELGKPDYYNLDDDIRMFDLNRALEGAGKPATVFDAMKSGLYHYLQVTRYPNRLANFTNNKIAFISGYRAARAEGLGHAEAYDAAIRMVRSTQLTGGRAARPPSLFARSGSFGSPLSLIYSLQHYATAYYGQMWQYGMEAIGRGGLRGQELWQAKRAFASMLTAQVALAGVAGLPFVGAAIGLAEQAGLDVQNGIQDFLVGQDDTPENRLISKLLLKGGWSPLLGIDLGPKFNVSSVPMTGLGAYGFDPTNALGAPGGVVKDLIKSGKALMSGEPGVGFENAAPVWLKGPIRLWRGDGNLPKVDTNETALTLEPGFDQIATLLGAKSARVSDEMETMRRMKRSAEHYKAELSAKYRDISDDFMKGDIPTGVKKIRELRETDNTLDIRGIVDAVVQNIEDETFGEDPARYEGRIAPEDRGRALWMLDNQKFTEQDRILLRQQWNRLLMQSIPELRTAARLNMARQLRKAQTLDSLMMQYGLPRQAVAAMIGPHGSPALPALSQ